MHPKYEILRRQIDRLEGRKASPEWALETIQLMLAAGASPEDLCEVSEHIKKGKIE